VISKYGPKYCVRVKLCDCYYLADLGAIQECSDLLVPFYVKVGEDSNKTHGF